MNIKKIDIFGTEYEIMYVDSIDIEKEFPDAEPNQTCDGLTDYDNRKIVVTTKSPDGSPKPKSEIQLTLLHELFHAFFQIMEIYYTYYVNNHLSHHNLYNELLLHKKKK